MTQFWNHVVVKMIWHQTSKPVDILGFGHLVLWNKWKNYVLQSYNLAKVRTNYKDPCGSQFELGLAMLS